MIAYKIVFNNNGTLLSFNRAGGCTVVYKVNEWVESHIENSLLFVFDSLSNARKYLESFRCVTYFHNYEIYECEVENLIPTRPLCTSQLRFAKDYWKDRSGFGYEFQTINGTFGTKRIKLIGVV